MNKKTIAFDIETIADRSIQLPEPEVKTGNLKDPAKIQEKIDAARAEQIARQALDPWANLICCFAWFDYRGKSGAVLLADENQEADLIREIWKTLFEYNFFVTFNGNAFDIPVIRAHSLIHRIRPSVGISTRKYHVENHFDVRAVLGNWDVYAKGTLDFYLQRLLNRSKPEDIDGSMVQEWWDVGGKDEIAEYCRSDARNTYDLFDLVSQYYL